MSNTTEPGGSGANPNYVCAGCGSVHTYDQKCPKIDTTEQKQQSVSQRQREIIESHYDVMTQKQIIKELDLFELLLLRDQRTTLREQIEAAKGSPRKTSMSEEQPHLTQKNKHLPIFYRDTGTLGF